MKFTSKKFLIILLLCCSQIATSMENEYTQNITKTPSKKSHKRKKSHKIPDERRIFDETVYKNNDSFDWNPKNTNQAFMDHNKTLESFRKKASTVPYTDQHEYRTILYDNDIPQHCHAMLKKIIKQNNIHKDKFSLFLAEKTSYFLCPPYNEDFHFSSPPQYSVNADSHFMKKLSLKAQEAWCLYLITIAMHRKSDFTHNTILLDERNKELFIGLAAKSEKYIDLFNTFVKETRNIPIDLYKEIRTIDKIYAELAWLKSYAV